MIQERMEQSMKHVKWLAIPLSLSLLVACGDENDDVTNPPENAPTEGTANSNDTANNGTNNNGETANDTTATNGHNKFQFTHFSLDVEYSVTKSFEVEYENEISKVEASYEDEINNEKLYGNDAYSKLEPIFQSFKFDENTADDEVIAEVLQGFNLAEDYQKLELEVRFGDGTEKEYRKGK